MLRFLMEGGISVAVKIALARLKGLFPLLFVKEGTRQIKILSGM
jgi:hypothetical protein